MTMTPVTPLPGQLFLQQEADQGPTGPQISTYELSKTRFQNSLVPRARTSFPNIGHYTCTIPWKGEGPNLVNNINEVLARQRRTNSSDYLVKKGTSLKKMDEKFQDQITKGYIEKIDLKKEDIY